MQKGIFSENLNFVLKILAFCLCIKVFKSILCKIFADNQSLKNIDVDCLRIKTNQDKINPFLKFPIGIFVKVLVFFYSSLIDKLFDYIFLILKLSWLILLELKSIASKKPQTNPLKQVDSIASRFCSSKSLKDFNQSLLDMFDKSDQEKIQIQI